VQEVESAEVDGLWVWFILVNCENCVFGASKVKGLFKVAVEKCCSSFERLGFGLMDGEPLGEKLRGGHNFRIGCMKNEFCSLLSAFQQCFWKVKLIAGQCGQPLIYRFVSLAYIETTGH